MHSFQVPFFVLPGERGPGGDLGAAAPGGRCREGASALNALVLHSADYTLFTTAKHRGGAAQRVIG